MYICFEQLYKYTTPFKMYNPPHHNSSGSSSGVEGTGSKERTVGGKESVIGEAGMVASSAGGTSPFNCEFFESA